MSQETDPYGQHGLVTQLCPFCKTDVIPSYTRGCEDCCLFFGIERFPAPLVTKAKKERRAVAISMNRVRVEQGEKPRKLRAYINNVRDHWQFVWEAGAETKTDPS